MRIGIFGGTFDPVHWGHIRTAREVGRQMRLARIDLMPSASPPHKHAGAHAAVGHRLAMLNLAVQPYPELIVNDIETRRRGPSFTIDTLTVLNQTTKDDKRLFLIVGLDAFLEMHTWKAFLKIFERVSLIVMSRPDATTQDAMSLQTSVQGYLHYRIDRGYQFDATRQAFVHTKRQPVHVCPVSPVAVSSTQIRRQLKTGQAIRGLVPASVEHYIQTKGLYQ